MSDLNKTGAEWLRFFDKYDKTSVLMLIVCLCLIATTISWFRAERAIDKATQSEATAQTWQVMYKETERECRLAQLEIDTIKIQLAKFGVELEHEDEKP